jgi:hypothetical protein
MISHRSSPYDPFQVYYLIQVIDRQQKVTVADIESLLPIELTPKETDTFINYMFFTLRVLSYEWDGLTGYYSLIK